MATEAWVLKLVFFLETVAEDKDGAALDVATVLSQSLTFLLLMDALSCHRSGSFNRKGKKASGRERFDVGSTNGNSTRGTYDDVEGSDRGEILTRLMWHTTVGTMTRHVLPVSISPDAMTEGSCLGFVHYFRSKEAEPFKFGPNTFEPNRRWT